MGKHDSRYFQSSIYTAHLARQCATRIIASAVVIKMNQIQAGVLFSVKDMVFVITGGGSGLGEMMALALDANGASKVFILGRRKASLEKVAGKAV